MYVVYPKLLLMGNGPFIIMIVFLCMKSLVYIEDS